MSVSSCSCRVCGEESIYRFSGRVIGREVGYFECPKCRYVQTQSPEWLEEAYQSAINLSDTGILRRNERNCRLVIRLLWAIGGLQREVVDFAGGYGILVRMLRDAGVPALWHDRYCENLVARGFEADEQQTTYLLTAFEVLEHLVHPTAELCEAVQQSDYFLTSTAIMPDAIPAHDQWWYYGREHGQHIGFYRRETLNHMAQEFGMHLNTDGRFLHLFSRNPLPSWKWNWVLKTRALAPLIRSFKLKSLVWDDHHRFAQRAA